MSGQKKTVRSLLETGAEVNAANREGVTALMAAARIGDAPLIRNLLERGADAAHKNAAGQTALDIAKKRKDPKTAEVLLSEMPGRLMDAVNRGYVEVVQRQIAKGAKVNEATANGWSPLMLASAKGNLQIALLLIAAKVDYAFEVVVSARRCATGEAFSYHLIGIESFLLVFAESTPDTQRTLTLKKKKHRRFCCLIPKP